MVLLMSMPLHVALDFARVLKLDSLESLLPSSGFSEAMIDKEVRVFGPSEGVSDQELDQISQIYRAVN